MLNYTHTKTKTEPQAAVPPQALPFLDTANTLACHLCTSRVEAGQLLITTHYSYHPGRCFTTHLVNSSTLDGAHIAAVARPATRGSVSGRGCASRGAGRPRGVPVKKSNRL